MIQSDNGPEFTNREFKHFLAKLKINQMFGMPYNPKSQGAVESFNKTIQRFFESAVYQKKSFDLEDSVNEFLYYYNNRKHSTTNMNSFNVMRNMDNKEVIEKVIMMTEKSRNKIKQTVENIDKGEVVRISTHFQIAKNSYYISFKPPVGLKKGIIKEKWLTKAIVLKNKINQCKVKNH